MANNNLSAENNLGDVLGGIFGATFEESEYTFRPGDKIADVEGGSLYYSGYERQGSVNTLLFTLLTDKGSIIVKFPDPDIIQVKTIKLKIRGFNNTKLVVEKVSRSLSE